MVFLGHFRLSRAPSAGMARGWPPHSSSSNLYILGRPDVLTNLDTLLDALEQCRQPAKRLKDQTCLHITMIVSTSVGKEAWITGRAK